MGQSQVTQMMLTLVVSSTSLSQTEQRAVSREVVMQLKANSKPRCLLQNLLYGATQMQQLSIFFFPSTHQLLLFNFFFLACLFITSYNEFDW